MRESGDKRGETQEALHAEREKLEQQEETLRQQLEETNALIASLTADTAELEEAVQTAADTATKLEMSCSVLKRNRKRSMKKNSASLTVCGKNMKSPLVRQKKRRKKKNDLMVN
ncbi:MAG: hypothetical protein V8Q32_00180 [Anaerotignum faecicola]